MALSPKSSCDIATSPYRSMRADVVDNVFEDGDDEIDAESNDSSETYESPGCCQRVKEKCVYLATEWIATRVSGKILRSKSWFKTMPSDTQSLVLEMGLVCKFALMGVATPNLKHVEVTNIWPPQEQTFFDESNAKCIEELGIWIPKEDEQSSSGNNKKTGVPETNWKKLRYLAMRAIDDEIWDDLRFADVEEGQRFCHDITNVCMGQMNIHEREQLEDDNRALYNAPDCDDSQGDLAYFGMGQMLVTRSDDLSLGEHMCDLRMMGSLEVRDAFERYGACAYFRYPSRIISCIYWCHGEQLVYPGDNNWEHVKWAWRCSMFLWNTAVHHLVHTHWIVSNAITTSARGLPVAHPIRRAMHINTFGAAKVNQEALLALRPRHSLLHHACALEYESLREVFILAAELWKYETLPEMFQRHDLPDEVKSELPIYADGMRFWRSFHTFYKAYIDVYYRKESDLLADKDMQRYWAFECVPQYQTGLPALSKSALADQLTHVFFNVSVFHQLVGDVIRYLKMPNSMCWHIREGEDMADAKSMLLTINIAAKTMRDMPEIIGDSWFFSNWKKHIVVASDTLAQQSAVQMLLQTLQVELQQLRVGIHQLNTVRPDGMRPEFWACSVSL